VWRVGRLTIQASARHLKSSLNAAVSAAPKKAPAKKASTTQCVATPTSPQQLVPSPAVNPSPLEEISDLLDTLPMDACVELTRRLITAVPSQPSGSARSRAVLKIVLLFVARRSRAIALRLALWNAYGVRGRRTELNHFLAQHGVDVRLVNDTHLDPGQAFRFANCLPPNRPIVEEQRNSYSGPSEYRALRSTCPGCEAPGGNCHRDEVGWQTNTLTLPTPDQVGPYRLLERRAPCPYGG
jgi:hypothetical protein